MKLARQKWDAEKIRKRVSKWLIFLFISFLISNIFLAYLIGSDKLLRYIKEGPFEHLSTLIPLLIFTAVFYFIFAWFREQVCIIACPYGRLQGVLLDNKSIVVAYDHKRGEAENGRKKWRNNEDRAALGHGDCIDCFQCVHVCPTGIDIRNGTQLECVNCTACIDECDTIMDKVGLPKGLIRYASEEEIEKKEKFKITARMKGYMAVLTILIGVLLGMLALRNDVEAKILRLPGQRYEYKENNIVSNVFTYSLLNKTINDLENVTMKIRGVEGTIKLVAHDNDQLFIPAENAAEGTLFIELDKKLLKGDKNKLTIDVYSNDKLIETTEVNFLGPRSY
jgi:cytochrome c oxidase accessory protein FixG